ncbi:MAG: DegT/DnrJ/EryC1/StrS family aminotransferase [Gammaproteobacteria bacterium]|nr:DegT/DnrJ/EryC1/StrS family aminotransferase [Gammaproteobacteria bacterium]
MQFIDLKAQQARIRDELERRIRKVLDHGQYILGPEVAEVEQRMAAYVGARHCLLVASGTDALLMALMALDVGPGDEVITTPFTFVATAETARLLGARLVFADIEPDTYNLDPAQVEARITPRTKAIIPVDLFGQCADYGRIEALARARGIAVIEDAAQSFGATQNGRRAGSFGAVACTSFFPAKPLGGYGDGGAVFTNDDRLAQVLREIRVHGQSGTYRYARVGINGRLDTLQAAILHCKLDIFDDELERRQAVARRYDELLGGAVRTPAVRPHNLSAWAQYTIELDRRDAVRDSLRQAGVPSMVYYPVPLHRQAPYHDARAMPVAERAAQRVLSLPMHPYLEPDDQARAVRALRQALAA